MVQLTMLNSMAGSDFEESVRQHAEWGLHWLDLKDSIFGKRLIDLTFEEMFRARDIIAAHGLGVWCLSTGLFFDDIEQGEAVFTERLADAPARAAKLSQIFRPEKVRLLAARSSLRDSIPDSMHHLDTRHPWLIPMYAKVAELIEATNTEVTIENEVHGCILANADEITGFFARLKAVTRADVSFTWDVQNLWQMGQFPSMEIYRTIRPLMRYYHLKGGMRSEPGGPLVFASSLEDASWPVVELTGQVLRDGLSPVICLNPSHGNQKPGYDYINLTQRNIQFLREHFKEIQ